ncbi:hypothetical protein FB107DRAFT_244897 [Schizophyllum commune]
MSLNTEDPSAPTADVKAAPCTSEPLSKHVSFATVPAMVKSRTAAKATTTGPPHKTGTAASSRKRPRPRQRHMVYAIKLTEEGMKSFQEEHFGPPPAGLTEEQRRTWWRKRKCSLSVIIPRHCIHRFNLHAANPSLVSFTREGNILESVVAFADNSSRRTSALPSPQLVAEVAKYMHQEGDKAQWYRFAKTGD